jgi:hypothetical protein
MDSFACVLFMPILQKKYKIFFIKLLGKIGFAEIHHSTPEPGRLPQAAANAARHAVAKCIPENGLARKRFPASLDWASYGHARLTLPESTWIQRRDGIVNWATRMPSLEIDSAIHPRLGPVSLIMGLVDIWQGHMRFTPTARSRPGKEAQHPSRQRIIQSFRSQA